jgi:hypothetical protein
VSLWEKTLCRGCSHPRWLHKGGTGSTPWQRLTGYCTKRRMEGRKAVLCACEGFVEHEPVEDPEFSVEDWRVINQIHSEFPNVPFTHNELAEIIARWEELHAQSERPRPAD